MTSVGVIGAGVMGSGVTQDLVAHGHDVVLVDRDEQILERARAEIERYTRMAGLFGKPSDSDTTGPTGSVTCVTDLKNLDEVEMVIENITEDRDLKTQLYPELDRACPPEAVFAVNTSAIPVTRIAALTSRPGLVIGTHFMNPVPLKRTVEVIRGWHTRDDAVERVQKLLASCGKEGIVVRDSPGFVSNRVLMLTINEAIGLVHDGVADGREIDRLFRGCFGHPMGPLETADLIGLDTVLLSIEVLYQEFNDGKYRPCPLLRRMVDAGLHGRKSGRGFYDYT
jgi:3-hydroxybutyryl-CoA dehydrogenase